MAMWNEMGNSNTSLKEEGDVSAEATAKSPIDDTREEAEAVLHLAEEAETTGAAREEFMRDEVSRDDMKLKIQQILAEEPPDSRQEAEGLDSNSKGETGLMDVSTDTSERNGSEQFNTNNPPEVAEEPNQHEHEDGCQRKRTTPVCMNLEDAALSTETNFKSTASESEPVEEGMVESTDSRSSHTSTETSLGGIWELLGPAEAQAGDLSASNELGWADGKESAIVSTFPSYTNKDDSLAEIDALVEESISISTVQDILEDDANLGNEADKTYTEMKSLEMGEPGDTGQNGGEAIIEGEENSRSNNFSSLDPDNAILDCGRSIPLQTDEPTVEDEGIILAKQTDLIGIPSTTDIREVGGHFECKADQFPSEDAVATDLANTGVRTKIVGEPDCPNDEGGAFEAVKAPEFGIIEEVCPAPRDEHFVGSTLDILTLAESKEVVEGIPEAEKPTEDKNSEIKRDAQASSEDSHTFDPLKLNLPVLNLSPIDKEASRVGPDGGGGLSREDKEVLDSRSQGSKPDKAVNLRMKKSPSFDFDLRITRTEESDRTPLLFQDKRVVRPATDYGNAEKKKHSFGTTDSRAPSLVFSREEHEASGEFHNRGIPEKQEKVLLLAPPPAKELEVVEGPRPSSPEQKGKRRPRSSLFGNCMCCATVIN